MTVTLHLLSDEHDKTLCERDNPSVHVVVGLLSTTLRVHKLRLLFLDQHQHIDSQYQQQHVSTTSVIQYLLDQQAAMLQNTGHIIAVLLAGYS